MTTGTLRIIGDVTSARQALASLSHDMRSAQAQADAMKGSFSGIASNLLGASPFVGQGSNGVGGLFRTANAELSSYGKAIKLVTQDSFKLADGTTILGAKLTTFTGDFDRLVAANTRFKGTLDNMNQAMDRAAGGFVPDLQNRFALLGSEVEKAGIAQGSFATRSGGSVLRYVDAASGRFVNLNRVLGETGGTLREYAEIEKGLARAEAARLPFIPAVNRGQAGVNAALTRAPTLPDAYNQLNQISPKLLRTLQAEGLGGGAAFGSTSFASNIAKQGAYESLSITKDIANQVYQVTGRYRELDKVTGEATGVIKTFTAQTDNAGNVLTRFGGRLSGLSNIFKQIGRDFQKVAEYAIATTTIFAAYQQISKSIGDIIVLNKSLTQLGITANLSGEQTKNLFNGIADIAFKTATPLNDLVAAADDVALATRRAGQSSLEWQKNILSLINSVGILTNLAGIDTVKATDLLVATMKQLGLTADELPSILNKITAVAGGQSAAIADITQGLGVMAEAGQQAGLSVDEMIATVQTLSQVTAKSPSEVATAFKNLVGSLTSSGSIKALNKYGIDLKDSAGNIRNILDIYTEISQKINSGIIPTADIQALVKAISGGPRRAPDAAALLSSINDIQGVTQKSINSTNEALLANQKILDTTAAKLTQIGVEVNKFAYSKFGEALKNTIDTLLGVVTSFLQLINSLPASLATTAIKFIAVTVALKLLGNGFNFAKATLTSFNLDLLNTTVQLTKTEAALLGVNAASKLTGRQTLSVIGNRGGAAIKSSLALGAVTAGLSYASNSENPLEAGLLGLQALGIGLVTSAPVPQLKILGAVLAGAGFLLEGFSNNTKKATASQLENAQAVLANVQAYKENRETVTGLNKEQDTLQNTIDRLSETKKKTTDDTIALSSAQSDYADNTIKLIEANNSLATSFATLRDSLTPDLRAGFEAAQANLLDAVELHKIELEATKQFLQQSNPNLVGPGALRLPGLNVGANNLNRTGSSLVTGNGFGAPLVSGQGGFAGTGSINIPGNIFTVQGQQAPAFDLKGLKEAPDQVKKLFDSNNHLNVSFDQTHQNFDFINKALDDMKDKIPAEQLQAMVSSVAEVEASADSFGALTRNLQIYGQYIQTQALFGEFTAEQAAQATKFLSLYGGISQLIQSSDLSSENTPYGPSPKAALQGQISNILGLGISGQADKITKDDYIALARGIAEARGEQLSADQVFINAAHIAESLGVSVDGLTDKVKSLKSATELAKGQFDELKANAITDRAQRNLGLTQQLHSGSISPKEFRALFDESEAAYASTLKLGKALTTLENTPTSQFADFEKILTSIPGLEDAVGLSAGDLTTRIETMLISMGLTAQQAKIFTADLLDLAAVSTALADARMLLHIDVDVTQAIVKLKALIAVYEGLLATIGHDPASFLPGHEGATTLAGLNRAQKDLEALLKAQKSGTSVAKLIKELQKGALGGPKASATKAAAAARNVGLLDIPDEIANSANEADLVKQAIANAKKLQSKIPGQKAKDKNEIVELLDGTKKVAEVRGVSEELLRRALDELRKKIQQQIDMDSKANMIQRIRVGSGSFAALANVPLNSNTGASVGGPNGPISINLNINGQILTPAQFDDLANRIGAALKKQLGG